MNYLAKLKANFTVGVSYNNVYFAPYNQKTKSL